jgi:hypothetical protein
VVAHFSLVTLVGCGERADETAPAADRDAVSPANCDTSGRDCAESASDAGSPPGDSSAEHFPGNVPADSSAENFTDDAAGSGIDAHFEAEHEASLDASFDIANEESTDSGCACWPVRTEPTVVPLECYCGSCGVRYEDLVSNLCSIFPIPDGRTLVRLTYQGCNLIGIVEMGRVSQTWYFDATTHTHVGAEYEEWEAQFQSWSDGRYCPYDGGRLTGPVRILAGTTPSCELTHREVLCLRDAGSPD